jgi:putative transcription factor
MGCDLCGREGQLYQAKIEGTVMTVCDSCKGYGELIRRLPTAKEKEQAARGKALRKEEAAANISSAPKGEVLLLVRPDYARVVKAARERLGLKQEEMAKRLRIRESQLHTYETGSRAPDIETARRLEKELKVKLVLEHEETGEAKRGGAASGPLTIGDLLRKK